MLTTDKTENLVQAEKLAPVYVILPYLRLGGQTGTSLELGVGPLLKAFVIESLNLSLKVLYSKSLYVCPKLKSATSTTNLDLFWM